MPLTAFQPMGNTVLVAASSSTASTPTQVSTGSPPGMFLSNGSTIPVYIATAATSAVQAACPTTAVPCPGMCIPVGWGVPITSPPGAWLSAATSAGSALLFATPGAYGS